MFIISVQSKGPSLSTLVHQCLGYPLDKSDQFSNWEKRPLRESQLIYASLDAYCLIQVYDVLKRCCESANFPFEETCYTLMSSTKSSKRKPKKHVQKKVKIFSLLPLLHSFRCRSLVMRIKLYLSLLVRMLNQYLQILSNSFVILCYKDLGNR